MQLLKTPFLLQKSEEINGAATAPEAIYERLEFKLEFETAIIYMSP